MVLHNHPLWNSYAKICASRFCQNICTCKVKNEHGERNSGELTGRQGISSDVLVAAVEELYALGVAERKNGDWIIGDDLFRDWICSRPKFEF